MYSKSLTENEKLFVKKYLRRLKIGSVIGFLFLLFVTFALNGGYLYFRYLSPSEMQKPWMVFTIAIIDVLLLAGFIFIIKYHKRSKNIGISDVIKISGIYTFIIDNEAATIERFIGDTKVLMRGALSKHIQKGESITAEAVVITRPIGKTAYFIDTLVLSVNDKYFVDKSKCNLYNITVSSVIRK